MSATEHGKWLQDEIARISDDYERRGLARIKKVDPPLRIIGNPFKGKGRVIPLTNPFLDFMGTWTARAGRTIVIEAKSTQEPKLPFGKGGLDADQWRSIQEWRQAGAAVAVLWGLKGVIRYVPYEAIRSVMQQGVKHIKWECATEIPAGMGFCTCDFLHVLGEYHPEKKGD